MESDYLHVYFNTILDSIDFTQKIHRPVYSYYDISDLVLNGIECEAITVFHHKRTNSEYILDP